MSADLSEASTIGRTYQSDLPTVGSGQVRRILRSRAVISEALLAVGVIIPLAMALRFVIAPLLPYLLMSAAGIVGLTVVGSRKAS